MPRSMNSNPLASGSVHGAEMDGGYIQIRLPQGPGYKPTGDVPIVTPIMKVLVEAVDRGTTRDVRNIIMHLADDQYRSGRRPNHMHAFVQNRDLCDTLVSSIPRHMIKAMILGVVATVSDCLCPPDDPLHIKMDTYACDGPGTYVANIAVRGRHGRGYTGRELQTIVRTMQDYVLASSTSFTGEAEPEGEQLRLALLAQKIDNVYGKATWKSPAFIQNDTQCQNVEALINTLASMSKQENANTAIAQLPGYYGCSTDSINTRGASHEPRRTWTRTVGNYTHWLLMSIMKHHGLEPDVRVTAVIRTWFAGSLSASEIIGTTLGMGGSHVSQNGLNVVWPGTQGDDNARNFDRDEAAVMQYRTYLRDNKAHSDAEDETRNEILRYMDDETIHQKLVQLDKDMTKLEETVAKANAVWLARRQQEEEDSRLLQEAYEEAEKENEFWVEFAAVLEEILPFVQEDEGEEDAASAST